jgi:hypothetical protein
VAKLEAKGLEMEAQSHQAGCGQYTDAQTGVYMSARILVVVMKIDVVCFTLLGGEYWSYLFCFRVVIRLTMASIP